MLRAPTGRSLGSSGVDRMALIPSDLALGMKAGHRVSASSDSAWNRRPSVAASTQGPCRVSYWSVSMSTTVWSVAATVAR